MTGCYIATMGQAFTKVTVESMAHSDPRFVTAENVSASVGKFRFFFEHRLSTTIAATAPHIYCRH
jgi:hypothetical protein